MKAGRLVEILKLVSPDTGVMCGVTTEDTPTLLTINLFDLEKTQKYEVKSVLTKPNDDRYCTLLIKKGENKWNLKVVGESFKKYAPKDPERMDNHTDDETPEDIYNELKKEVLDLCYERASKRRESYRQRDKKWKKKY